MGCVRGLSEGILAARVGVKRSYGVCEGDYMGRIGCMSGHKAVTWGV